MRLRNPETGKGAPFWRSLSKALKTYSKGAPSYNVFPRAKINSAIAAFTRILARRLPKVPTAYVHPAIEVKRRFRLSIEKATLIPDTLSHEKRTRTMRAALAACCVDHRAVSCLRLPGALPDQQL